MTLKTCAVFGVVSVAILVAGPLAMAQQERSLARTIAARVQAYEPQRLAELEKRFDELAARHKESFKATYEIKTGEPQRIKLFRADPKLLENNFVAQFMPRPATLKAGDDHALGKYNLALEFEDHLLGRSQSSPFFARFPNRQPLPDDVRKLIAVGGAYWFHPNETGDSQTPIGDYIKQLLERCPEAMRPEQQLVHSLTAQDAGRDVIHGATTASVSGRGDSGQRFITRYYHIYSKTEEEAQQRAETILQLLECGMCRPMREYYLSQGRESLESIRKGVAKQTELLNQIDAAEQSLAKPSEITPDILSQLKAQKVMVAVELAGLSARVKACDEMLKDPRKLEVSTLQSVSDMKVKAEIERIGIKEKLDQINTFISEGDDRGATQDRLNKLSSERAKFSQQLSRDHRTAEAYAALVELYLPFRLQNDTLTIAPVEWSN